MSNHRTWPLGFALALAYAASPLTGIAAAQTPAAVAQAPVNVLKIAAGPAGAESNGTFVLTEERSIFSRSEDREVVVFFHWDGLPGPHKLVAQWRSPDGGLTSTSAVDYVAKDRRFGAYWRLTLSPSMTLGTWSIEVTVDGQPGGRHTFEVKDEKVTGVVVKRPLSQADLYERLNRAFVVMDRSTAAGRAIDPAGGFVPAPGRIYTAMAAIEATDRLHAVAMDGARQEITAVAVWDRRQDWAIVETKPSQDEALPVAAPATIKVGDRIFSIEGGVSGGRVLIEGSLTGQTPAPGGGVRYLAVFLTGSGMPGGPVLNEFGELVGMVGGSNLPGAVRLSDILRARADLKGVPIVPFTQIRYRAGSTETLAALQTRGEIATALTGDEHVVSGGFAKEIARGPAVSPSDQRDQFTSQDKTFVAWINWSPKDRIRGQGALRMYDADNRVVIESKPAKVDLKKGQLSLSSWTLPVPTAPGHYRVDATIDGKPYWRGFVRILP